MVRRVGSTVSVFNDARYSEELVHAIRGVGQHLVLRQAWPQLVVAHDVDHGHGMGGRLDVGGVQGVERVHVGQYLGELLLHARLLALAQVQAGQPRHVVDVDLHSSSSWAYCRDSRLRPTLAKRTVTTVSSPSRSTPTTIPSPKRPWRTSAPTLRGRSSSRCGS